MNTRMPILLILTILLLQGCATTNNNQQDTAFSDIHLHFNYRHKEIISAKETVDILKAHDVVLATVSSEPASMALEMNEIAGDWVIPFASPYYKAGNRKTWYFDKNLLAEMRKMLDTGRYGGIGEVHITSGIGPSRDSEVMLGLFDLAREYDLPFLLHTNAGNYQYFLPICQRHSDVDIIWAHAGGDLQPDQLRPLMQNCDNVWLDLTARDPWHYGHLTTDEGQLLPGWRDLIIDFQDRVMTGTDPVWNAHQTYRWYESDEGWDHYTKLIDFHRNWMKQLPEEVEKKVRLTNAQQFFNNPGRSLDN